VPVGRRATSGWRSEEVGNRVSHDWLVETADNAGIGGFPLSGYRDKCSDNPTDIQ